MGHDVEHIGSTCADDDTGARRQVPLTLSFPESALLLLRAYGVGIV